MSTLAQVFDNRAIKYTGGNPQDPAYWVKKLFGGGKTVAGIDINPDSALKYSSVWAAVNIISGAVGFLPMQTFRRIDERNKKPIINHPAYKLLHQRANPYMDTLTFREIIQSHALTWGNGYAEIERDGAGRAVALWPLRPDRVRPKVVIKKDGVILEDLNELADIDRYEKELVYEVTSDKKIVLLPFCNVLHIKGLGFDGLKGYSVISEYANENLALGLASEKSAAAFFGNDSSPAGLLTTDDPLSSETKEKIEEDWEKKHKGLDNKYRIAVLHSGLKWQQVGIHAKDAQLLQSREFSVNDVARWFQIPPHFIADLRRATFSNIEHQGINFVTYCLLRWLRRWELECNYKLFATREQGRLFTEFNVAGLLRGDTKSRYEAYNIGRQAGFLSVNDIHDKENMNPIEGGDTYLEPLNMKPAGTADPVRMLNIRDLFESTWGRIITKEINAMRTALKKPPTFEVRANAFYDRHIEHTCNVLQIVLRTIKPEIDAAALARDYVNAHREQIRQAHHAGGNAVENCLCEWELTEAASITARFFAENMEQGDQNGQE